MEFINTVDLKNQTNRVLSKVRKNQAVLVTLRGHPCAAIIPVSEEDVDDLVWEFSPKVQKRLKLAQKELQAGKTVAFRDILRKLGH